MDPAQATPAAFAAPASGIQAVVDLCADDMAEVDRLIRARLDSDVVLIRQIAEYIIGSGGKRLRPMLVALSARACGYRGDDHIALAAVIEFIHTATLLHDDVVDESELRRGRETVHAVWGNAASVLVGDFLYSRAFQMMVAVDSMPVMALLSDTTNRIAEGEVEQLLNMHDPDVTRERYFSVIEKKTAQLFEAACRLGALLAEQSRLEPGLARFGRDLGIAFQIADDVLDYRSDAGTMGKNTGDDLAEGKPTLPLIICRERVQGADRTLIDAAVREGDSARMPEVLRLIHDTGAIEAALAEARNRAASALEAIEPVNDSPWKAALSALAGYSVSRRF